MFPREFKPIFIENNELIRLGSVDDGGYVVPKQTILSSKLLVSLGISDNWDFEKHLNKLTNCAVEAYDYSINLDFWIKKFQKDLIKFLCLKIFKPKKLYKMFQFIDFLFFFKLNKNNNFFLKKIGNKRNLTSLSRILKKHKNIKNIFLKSDIEGSEYEILNDILKYSSQIDGFMIEFHAVKKNISKIVSFIKRSNKYKLAHIHGNNYSVQHYLDDPDVIELTFTRIEFFKKKKNNNKSYPIKGLDYPNIKRGKDVKLNFKHI